MKTIPELDDLSMLEDLAAEYSAAYGSRPFNLSHWDPSDETVRALLGHLELPAPPPAAPYIYSYELDLQTQVVQALGLTPANRDCLFVPNGTTAVLFAVSWLRAVGVKRVVVLCPSYFPVFHAAELVGLSCVRVGMARTTAGWELPRDAVSVELASSPSTALWVTNPVYCTGVYLGPGDAAFLNELLDQGCVVVADECLALSGRELGASIHPGPGFVGLYSPHKAVCMNAVKFAAVVFDDCFVRFFTDWADVLVGGLGASSYLAIVHFLSQNFALYQRAFLDRVGRAHEAVAAIISSHEPDIYLDADVHGYFATCYAPRTREDGRRREFLREFVFRTGAMVIPGARNHFPSDTGFNFRLNLARACPQFFAALHRAMAYLAAPQL